MGPLHVGRLLNSATLLPDGNVMVAGGFDQNGKVTSSVSFYSPSRHLFERSDTPATPMSAAN